MSSVPTAPRPVIAKRHVTSQRLAPGQYLKVASRKPAPKVRDAAACDRFAGGPPRDPWEDLDGSVEEGRSSSASYPGSQEHHHYHATGGGRQHSGRASISRRTTEGTSQHGKESDRGSGGGSTPATKATPPMDDLTAAGDKDASRSAAVDSDEDDSNYYSTSERPELSAAERAQLVLEAQRSALEAKQLEALMKQGVARRPKTLIRNRHGRLNAITTAPASGATEEGRPALLMCKTPVKPSSGLEKMRSPSWKAPEARLDLSASRDGECGSDGAVESPRNFHDSLSDSRPSTPLKSTSGQLEIDLD
ncbi:hypothetical protein LSCM1_07505 [Leishmania martiniquensis]|uniref:Uncharacterized protein n=1 Tax=Leishmania martiniquensis TaxID=1580590 RepID=A0A836HTW9_9TRYP|nr:hypothetical protein LSCM1_07505 [Leishmania martiniquensis]